MENSKSRILITGGAGFIGSYFSAALQEQGYQVVSLDLEPPTVDVPQVEYVLGDLRDISKLNEVMRGVDSVLHLAAAHHDFGISDVTFDEVNRGGAERLCESMERNNVRRLCFFSSVAVYGNQPSSTEECSVPQPSSPYGNSKLGAELVFKEWASRGEHRECLIIRPTVTFGPRNFANMYTLIEQIDRGRFYPVGNGLNLKSLCFIENIVAATLETWLASRAVERFEILNYVDKPDLTSGEITSAIYECLGKRVPTLSIPYWLARVAVFPLDIFIRLFNANLPISGNRIAKLARSETQFDSSKIRERGYSQKIELKEGIRRMVEWYLAEGKQMKSQCRRVIPPPSFRSPEIPQNTDQKKGHREKAY